MKESVFQTEWKHSLSFFPQHYIKIPDPSSKFNQAQKRPYDCYSNFSGIFYAFELKQMKKCEAFAFESLEPHQEFYLKEVIATGGMAFVVINYRFKLTEFQMAKYKINVKKQNICFAIDIWDYEMIKDYFTSQGRKSIPFGYILDDENFIKIIWNIEHKVWDLRAIIN